MFGISGAEVMVILLVALVVLGPDRLPVVARKAGQVLGEIRKVSAGFEAEMRSAMYDQPAPPAAPPEPERPAIDMAATETEHGADDHS
jgi:Tat protein translocase TatB subunit